MNCFSNGKWLSFLHIELVMICNWYLRAKIISMVWERKIQIISIFLLIDEYVDTLIQLAWSPRHLHNNGNLALDTFWFFQSTTYIIRSTALCQWEVVNLHIINDGRGVDMNQSPQKYDQPFQSGILKWVFHL